MKHHILIVLVLLGSAALAQTCSGGSCTAASCSSADVQAAYNAAGLSDGGTITVPAGSCTWTTAVSPSCKSVTLLSAGTLNSSGANTGGATITFNMASGFGNDALFVSGCSGKQLRVSGFTWQYESADSFGLFMITGGTGLSFRLDHNTIKPFPATPGYGRFLSFRIPIISPGAVADHNIVTDEGFVIENISPSDTGSSGGPGSPGGAAWAAAPAFETVNAFYFENNTMTYPSYATHQVDLDADNGGFYVFRYNTESGNTVGNHGFDSVYNSAIGQDVYQNTLSGSTQPYTVQWRGGSGVVYLNTDNGSASSGNEIAVTTYRANSNGFIDSTAGSQHGYCDGTQTIDGNNNTGSTFGWPCYEQIGRTSGTSGGGLVSSPLYEWGNYTTASGCPGTGTKLGVQTYNPGSATLYQLPISNNDFYDYTTSFSGASGVGCGVAASLPATCSKGVAYWETDANVLKQCSATNTWTTFYTPFSYPHPLVGGQAATPSCSPASGSSVSPISVTCTNSNSGTTIMCYTLNGSTPITNGAGTGCNAGTALTGASNSISINTTVSTLLIVAGTSTLSDSSVQTYGSYTITPAGTLAPAVTLMSAVMPSELIH